jgi:hypothetical protein
MTRDEVITSVNNAENYARQVDAVLRLWLDSTVCDEEDANLIAAILTVNKFVLDAVAPITALIAQEISDD